MLHQLNPLVKYLPENTQGRDFVVGDLHGCIRLLGELLREVEFDPVNDRLMSVGDLVDRGPDNIRTLELLTQKWFYPVLGNHEDLTRYSLLANLRRLGLCPEEYDHVSDQELGEQHFLHIRNGGKWVMDDKIDAKYCLKYLDLINQMPIILVVGKDSPERYHVVHSEILSWDGMLVTNDYIDDLEHEPDNIYGTQNFFWGRNFFGSPSSFTGTATGHTRPRWQDFQSPYLAWTYCGHTPKDLPMIVGRQINIDTCAFYASFIDKERNGTKGLTIADPKTWKYWTVNGASGFISEGNLGER